MSESQYSRVQLRHDGGERKDNKERDIGRRRGSVFVRTVTCMTVDNARRGCRRRHGTTYNGAAPPVFMVALSLRIPDSAWCDNYLIGWCRRASSQSNILAGVNRHGRGETRDWVKVLVQKNGSYNFRNFAWIRQASQSAGYSPIYIRIRAQRNQLSDNNYRPLHILILKTLHLRRK